MFLVISSRQHHRVLSLDPASLMSEVDYLADLGQSFQHSPGIVDAHKYSSRTPKSQKYGDLEVSRITTQRIGGFQRGLRIAVSVRASATNTNVIGMT